MPLNGWFWFVTNGDCELTPLIFCQQTFYQIPVKENDLKQISYTLKYSMAPLPIS